MAQNYAQMTPIPPISTHTNAFNAPVRSGLNFLDLPPKSALTEIVAVTNYDTNQPIRTAIQNLKYQGQTHLAQKLGARLLKAFQDLKWSITQIVAVPLHPARLRERGYNQAALLAEVVADGIGVPFHRETVRRIVNTATQTKLKGAARFSNVMGAFTAEPDLARDQIILLIDDVCTTGATLNACAYALIKAGAKAVYGLTVAGVPLGTTRNHEPRKPSLRLVKLKSGYQYAQLVFPDGKSKSLGAFNPTNPVGLCDHALEVMLKGDLTPDEIAALRDANKAFRPVCISPRDMDLPRVSIYPEPEQQFRPALRTVIPEAQVAAAAHPPISLPSEPEAFEGLLITGRRILRSRQAALQDGAITPITPVLDQDGNHARNPEGLLLYRRSDGRIVAAAARPSLEPKSSVTTEEKPKPSVPVSKDEAESRRRSFWDRFRGRGA